MRKLFFGLLLAAFVPSMARAAYLADRATWNRLGPTEKASYAMGVMDAANILFDSDSKEGGAVKRGRVRCLADLRFTPDRLAGLVDNSYAQGLEDPPRSPSQTLIARVSAMCARQIEEERLTLGLPASR